jgi:hypothetical protein
MPLLQSLGNKTKPWSEQHHAEILHLLCDSLAPNSTADAAALSFNLQSLSSALQILERVHIHADPSPSSLPAHLHSAVLAILSNPGHPRHIHVAAALALCSLHASHRRAAVDPAAAAAADATELPRRILTAMDALGPGPTTAWTTGAGDENGDVSGDEDGDVTGTARNAFARIALAHALLARAAPAALWRPADWDAGPPAAGPPNAGPPAAALLAHLGSLARGAPDPAHRAHALRAVTRCAAAAAEYLPDALLRSASPAMALAAARGLFRDGTDGLVTAAAAECRETDEAAAELLRALLDMRRRVAAAVAGAPAAAAAAPPARAQGGPAPAAPRRRRRRQRRQRISCRRIRRRRRRRRRRRISVESIGVRRQRRLF